MLLVFNYTLEPILSAVSPCVMQEIDFDTSWLEIEELSVIDFSK